MDSDDGDIQWSYNGGSTPQTATITITGITDNRDPVVGDPVTAT